MSKVKVLVMTMAVMASLFSNNSVMAAKMEKTEVAEKNQSQEEMQEVNSRIEKLQEKITEILEKMENVNSGSALVNPNQGRKLSYTQDAANSQENSTVIFKYAPNQLYKIYCRVGYLTDIAMKKRRKNNICRRRRYKRVGSRENDGRRRGTYIHQADG